MAGDAPETAPAPGRSVRAPGIGGEAAFLRRVLIVAAVAALALLLWIIRDALLLTFAGVVVATLLLALARPVQHHLGLSSIWSLAAVGLFLALMLGIAGLLVGNEVAAQIGQLWDQLPRAVRSFEDRFNVDVPTLGEVSRGQGSQAADSQAGIASFDTSLFRTVLGQAATVGSFIFTALTALVLVVVGGFFLAANPQLYRRGIAMLLPFDQQARAEDALTASGEALRLWLGAQLISMTLVGTLAGLGTWLIGLPSPLALGLFAGLAGFVPLIGAVAGAVPALLLALGQDGNAFLWTALLFVGVQQLESNMILPLVQKHMVNMPPALLLFAVVAVGLLFGLPGVLLAAPLTVVSFVLVKKLYVRQTLGQQTTVPGEDS